MAKKTRGLRIDIILVLSVLSCVLCAFGSRVYMNLQVSPLAQLEDELNGLVGAVNAQFELTGCFLSKLAPLPLIPGGAILLPGDDGFATQEKEITRRQATWSAEGLEIPSSNTLFRLSVIPSAAGCGSDLKPGDKMRIRAEADLDRDGRYSVYERILTLVRDGHLRENEPILVLESLE